MNNAMFKRSEVYKRMYLYSKIERPGFHAYFLPDEFFFSLLFEVEKNDQARSQAKGKGFTLSLLIFNFVGSAGLKILPPAYHFFPSFRIFLKFFPDIFWILIRSGSHSCVQRAVF